MGDRNIPIKFGPEWLRMATAAVPANSGGGSNGPSAGGSNSSSPSSGSVGSHGGAGGSTGNTNMTPKVQLAKLRYGREEMLALYDPSYITQESPAQLKYIDILYQVKEKPPFALNSTFEHEMRDNMRGGPLISGLSIGDRINRGITRGPNVPDNRNRPRMQFEPHQAGSSGRSGMWHGGSTPRSGFSTQLSEEDNNRGWNNSAAGNPAASRNGREQPRPWQPNDPAKIARTKRPTINTNWRNSQREEGSDEWRSSRAAQEKRGERGDWGERQGGGEKPWSGARRTWMENDNMNTSDETLPEWAVGSAEPVAGTFDSSGAFHGYSNDDCSLPRPQDSSHALTRSQTHGAFARSKTMEEGSEEWWASEKAKKLSPKKFDATEIKFKKLPNSGVLDGNNKQNQQPNKHENPQLKHQSSREEPSPQEAPDKPSKFGEGTYDGSVRVDVHPDETGNERGDFQSVMIAPNNSLRQKHQNIVAPAKDSKKQDNPPNAPKEESRSSNNLSNNTNNQIQTNKEEFQRQQNDPFAKGLSKEDSFGQQKMPATKEEVCALAHANQTILGQQKPSSLRASPEEKNEEAIVDQLLEMSLDGNKDMMSKLSTKGGFLQQSHILLDRPNSTFAANSMTQLQSPLHMGMNQSLSSQSLNINQSGMMNSGGMALLHSMRMKNTLDVSTIPLSQAKMGMPQGGLLDHPSQSIANTSTGNPMGTNNLGNLSNANLNPSLGNISNANLATSSTGISQLPGYQPTGLHRTGDDYGELYLGQTSNSAPIPLPSDIPMPPSAQVQANNMYGLHNSGAPQNAFRSSLYGNMLPQPANSSNNMADQWYYEDPNKVIQGPFPSKEMYNWYRAGFFSPTLMVRRAIDTHMRPLGSYGPVVPFAQVDMMPPAFGFDSQRAAAQREPNPTQQPGLGMDVDALWRQPSPDMVWMSQLGEQRYNKLPMYFWDAQSQSSVMAPNSSIPNEITKDMKTEDEILAQLRATQNIRPAPKQTFLTEEPALPKQEPSNTFSAPNLEELQKLIQKETLKSASSELPPPSEEPQVKQEKVQPTQPAADKKELVQPKPATEAKATKQAKNEAEKNAKKDVPTQKSKKKNKEDKRDNSEASKEEDSNKTEKKSVESSPSKQKEKVNKKELEKEKKEWIKEGFTIVKGCDKKEVKDNKKKADEAAKLAEEAERKRNEEEKLALEEERKRKQLETLRKQQEHQHRQASEFVSKKAPWSAITTQATQAAEKDGMTLAEIQLLERKKKMEQMKEQQQMMQMIAQQQATALAREQEMQASLGWAKKKNAGSSVQGPSLAEIQAEARKQALAVQAQALEEVRVRSQRPPSPAQVAPAPWAQPNGGFWDAQPAVSLKPLDNQKTPENVKPAEPPQQPKKKKNAAKKESTPGVEFEAWCSGVLASWSSKIDVPTFVGFLKDIESPYEVKDYVKYYLGESREAGDFARHFLERRSKLLRVGMVTPSDDLCSPAVAVNPRTNSVCEYQEGKGKKTKKNKMLKVDARILGFSVTAAEDRINVGDIDTV